MPPSPGLRVMNLALLLTAAALAAGCEAEPSFPANDPALARLGGTVLFERELVAGTQPQKLDEEFYAWFDIPAGVAPAGTHFTLRVIHGVDMFLPEAGGDVVWNWDSKAFAVQVAPATIVFSSPIILRATWFPSDDHPRTLDVLHAASGETTWQRVGPATQVDPPFSNDALVPVTGGGLWSVAWGRGVPAAAEGTDAPLD